MKTKYGCNFILMAVCIFSCLKASPPNICSWVQVLVCSDGAGEEETGPPLEGTGCGGAGTHWCRAGRCVPVQGTRWADWQAGPCRSPAAGPTLTNSADCRSGCLQHGTGARLLSRSCLALPGWQADCAGPRLATALCGDTAICHTRAGGRGRTSPAHWAAATCARVAGKRCRDNIHVDHCGCGHCL